MRVKIGNYRSDRAKRPRIEHVQIHPWDTYSADHTLSLIIYPLLVAFREDVVDKGGVPSDFLPPVDVSEMTEEEALKVHDETYAEGQRRWLECLDKMIWAFEQAKNDYTGENEFIRFREETDVPNFDDVAEDTITAYERKIDIDNDGLNDYYEKIDEGLALFARYYRSLWW